jgi:hypothetical protein
VGGGSEYLVLQRSKSVTCRYPAGILLRHKLPNCGLKKVSIVLGCVGSRTRRFLSKSFLVLLSDLPCLMLKRRLFKDADSINSF